MVFPKSGMASPTGTLLTLRHRNEILTDPTARLTIRLYDSDRATRVSLEETNG